MEAGYRIAGILKSIYRILKAAPNDVSWSVCIFNKLETPLVQMKIIIERLRSVNANI